MYSMNYIGKFIANFREFYNEINGATLTGAIDVVVVEQPDGTYTSSPFHVRFGKLGVLRSRFKVVDLELNGEPLNIHMKLGESGEAFFVEEIPEDELEASAHLATSPIPESRFEQIFSGQEPGELTPRRRNSVSEYPNEAVYENQISDFSKRRYTDGLNCKPELVIPKREYQMYKDEKEKFNDYTPSPSTIEQEPMFPMEGLDDAPAATWDGREPVASTPETNVITPKTFKPTDLSENESVLKDVVRKISINNDFRPISIEKDQTDTKEIQSNIDVRLVEDQKQQNNGKKKKKTKKSGSKKKHQRKSSSSSNTSTVSEQVTPETPIDKYPTPGTSGAACQDDSCYDHSKHPSDLHFFSDPEIDVSKLSQDSEARACSPVQSDSELEVRRGAGPGGAGPASGQSWRWGELPEPLPRSAIAAAAADALSSDEENAAATDTPQQGKSSNRSAGVLSGMFSFMKQKGESESIRVVEGTVGGAAVGEGVYLADLADGGVDPEVAALYFPPPHHTQSETKIGGLTVDVNAAAATEEDYESGNGPSLPQSPSSMDGATLKSIDSDDEDLKIFNKGYVGVSLCGRAVLSQSPALAARSFQQGTLDWDEFCRAPHELLQDPRLVLRLGVRYLTWTQAAPHLLAVIAYHRPLPTCGALLRVDGDSGPEGSSRPLAGQDGQSAPAPPAYAYSSWWSWRKSADKQGVAQEETVLVTEEAKEVVVTTTTTTAHVMESQDEAALGSDALASEEDPAPGLAPEDAKEITAQEATEENVTECPAMDIPLGAASAGMGGEGYSGSQSSEESDDAPPGRAPSLTPKRHSTDRFRKTLRLTSQQIASLDLKEGMNEVVFSVTTAYQGTTRCKCNLFKWKHDDKIVISDIDGTITKSDVLGHIFPMVGKDWAQSGVAQLFTKIKNNGYKLLYLSARAIGQAKVTREYLRSIKQGSLSLPDGPLLLNPTSLLRALHREVIEKKPEEFKIQCLSDIRALFPADANPFYAGYGNRTNDVCAYQAVGIPIVRIFTINYKGELKHELTQTFQSTYSHMAYMVDQMFPPVLEEQCEDFSQYAFWRQPVLTVEQLACRATSPASACTTSPTVATSAPPPSGLPTIHEAPHM